MTVNELMEICSELPKDAEVRFTSGRYDNPHDDYYDVVGAYLLQFQTGENPTSALYVHGTQ